MGLLQKLLLTKTRMEDYIEKYGMEAAVKKYSLTKLLKNEVLFQYKDTELYSRDTCIIDYVFNQDGKCLGSWPQYVTSYLNFLGCHNGVCLNGNVVLRSKYKNQMNTYGVFDKSGNPVVEYDKYFKYQLLPNGVALMSVSPSSNKKLVTIHYDGSVKFHDYSYIENDMKNDKYTIYKRQGEYIYTSKEVDKDFVIRLVEGSTKLDETEKGIE